jgi:hypothetical protein
MGNLIVSWAANHQQLVIGFAAGAAGAFILSNPIKCAAFLFDAGVKYVPFLGPWVAKNPDKAKAWFDAFEKAIDDCVDKYAAAQKPPAPKP